MKNQNPNEQNSFCYSKYNKPAAYRPDIDGLRALAVVCVVLYHAFPSFCKGGFIGVDVFFVISGYLIGGIIQRDLAAGSFSFTNFYIRRIVRIFPALALVLATALVAAYFLLLSDEYQSLGKHAAGGAAFIANWLYWWEVGYWDLAAKLKPLLHLWSLGVEEQFYLIIPLLLALAWKNQYRLFTVISLLLLASFILNIHFYERNTALDFYSPFTRFWEIFAGVALASAPSAPDKLKQALLRLDKTMGLALRSGAVVNDGRYLRALVSLAGLACIGAGLSECRLEDGFPGYLALWPVAGALLIIMAGPQAWPNRYLLSLKVAVAVGLISYPLYLWHWPILSFINILGAEEASRVALRNMRLGCVAASVLLAWLTYWFIERPIRFGPGRKAKKAAALLIIMLALGGAALGIFLAKGLPERSIFGQSAQVLETYKDSVAVTITDQAAAYTYAPSLPRKVETSDWYSSSYRQAGSSNSTIALFGDSTARAGYSGVATFNQAHGINTFFVGLFAGGAPIPGIYDNPILNKRIEEIISVIINKKDIKGVFIMHQAGTFLHSYFHKKFPKNPDKYIKQLQELINILHSAGKEVFIVEEEPLLPHEPAAYKTTRLLAKKQDSLKNAEYDYSGAQGATKLKWSLWSQLKNVTIIPAQDFWIKNNHYRLLSPEGKLYYADKYHLSTAGSKLQAEQLMGEYLLRFKPLSQNQNY